MAAQSTGAAARSRPVLELDGLTRRFGDLLALDGLSFAVEEGEVFGFVGPNGAGKTTAMRIVLGVLAADAGEVRFDGRPVDGAARSRFGYMPEERGLYPKMTVGRQLLYFARLHGLAEAEARASAESLVDELGLEGRWDAPVESLSLGNQQRVQLAVALVHRPSLLVLDEPFSGLDPIGVDVLSAVLRRHAAEGTPVVFSSHQLDLVERLCDAVAIIDRGRLVASGPVARLAAGDGGRRYRIGIDGAGDQHECFTALTGVEVVGSSDGAVDVVLADGVDDQAVLDAARRAGRVVEFVRVRPRLADVFRDVIEQ
jgi:ABC-2 type transport system ATP-binding protein